MSLVTDKVLAISKVYLGPAAEPFIARQCKSHLKIDAQDLSHTNLKDLAKWVQVAAGLIMDEAKATEMAGKIAAV